MAPDRAPLRPRLAFRLGITGARPNRLEATALPALQAQVAGVLRHVQTTIEGLWKDLAVAAAYAPDPPLLRLFSPLAEGSDRIAAEAALGLGIHLEAPLPFSPEEYQETFASDPAPFLHLLAAARTEAGAPAATALDGSRAMDAEAAYRAVGRMVVRHSDLLIAIWDGQAGKPGGTEEIIRFAARSHVPIWWIAAGGGAEPRLLLGPSALSRPDAAPAGKAAHAALTALLRAALLPAKSGDPYHHTWMGQEVHHIARRLGYRSDPLHAYFAESEEPVRPLLWRAYARVLDRLAPQAAVAAPSRAETPAPDDDVETPWGEMFGAADRHANKYADRYRSSYVLIIVLAALTVAAMGAALAFPHALALLATAIEFVGLILILLALAANEFRRWHERWIAYRLLAELCRKQRMLARIGWSLPVTHVTELTGRPEQTGPLRDAWVAWYVTAAMRASELPHGPIANHVERARDLGQAMIAEQILYHQRRRDRARTAAHRLARIGECFFGVTFILVVSKLALLIAGDAPHAGAWLGFACVTLAAFSAGSVSLRAYAEFDLLHLQSERMLRALGESKEELEALRLARPLASQSLGAVLHALTLSMLQDVEGWSLLFRTKTPEAG